MVEQQRAVVGKVRAALEDRRRLGPLLRWRCSHRTLHRLGLLLQRDRLLGWCLPLLGLGLLSPEGAPCIVTEGLPEVAQLIEDALLPLRPLGLLLWVTCLLGGCLVAAAAVVATVG